MKSPELKFHDELLDNYLRIITDRHPHIGEKIRWFWGCAEFDLFVSNMFLDTRDGQRRGFDPSIIRALVAIQEHHDKMFPHLVKDQDDKWNIR